MIPPVIDRFDEDWGSMPGDKLLSMSLSTPVHAGEYSALVGVNDLPQARTELLTNVQSSSNADNQPTPIVRDAWPFASKATYKNGYEEIADALIESKEKGKYCQYVSAIGNIDWAYQCGEFDEALVLCNDLLESSDEFAVRLFALTKRVSIHVALGDGDAAYSDVTRAMRMCVEGIRRDDEYGTADVCCLCALSIEALLAARIFDDSIYIHDVSGFPQELRALLGYYLGCRALRVGKRGLAEGIAYSSLALVGSSGRREAVSCNLLAASVQLFNGNVEEASNSFQRAWTLGMQGQIVMPFVELDYCLLGLARSCDGIFDEPGYKKVTRTLGRYRKGWYVLRRRCGLPMAGESLTPLELYAVGLASQGWRNKEISAFLRMAENTLKHRLSSAYQKLGVRSRKEIRVLWHEFVAGAA